MRKNKSLIGSYLLIAAMGVMFTQCDAATEYLDGGALPIPDDICGPCGKIANGDAMISGDPKLDGIFKAVGTLKISTGSIRADFDARVRSLAEVFDVPVTETSTTADLVTGIKAAFDAQINANLQAGITVDYVPPSCSADVNVSVNAQAQCEAKAECNVNAEFECDPGELSFKCEGKCTGSCTGKCSGSCTVKASATAACSGTCTGSCDLSVNPGGCEGTCHGDCSGTCTLEDGSGQCHGECDGTCTGSCELPSAGGTCSGTCKGECTFDASADASCEGECSASCEGECSGGCEGKFDPPSCEGNVDANCSATAECKAQAEAQASASLECSPPSLDISYTFNAAASADASIQADVMAKLEAFKTEMVAIVQGMAQLEGLVKGNAELGIDPPVVTIAASAQAVGSDLTNLNIGAGVLPCVALAVVEAGAILTKLGTDMGATITAQADLFLLLKL